MIFLFWLIVIFICVVLFLWFCQGIGVIIGLIWAATQDYKKRHRR